MRTSAASAPLTSSTVAAQRPVRPGRSGSAAVSSSAIQAADATFRNSYRANLPDGAYSVEMPSIRTYSPSISAGHVMRWPSLSPAAMMAATAARSSSMVTPLLHPCSIRQVMKKYKTASTGTSQGSRSSRRGFMAEAASLRPVFFAIAISLSSQECLFSILFFAVLCQRAAEIFTAPSHIVQTGR